ncbi:phosphotransferase family protein [Conexibacter woesei]|uniref:Aminoglycoside phosphotransferase n=1 Tax=Conexibacter woesei (strain DSM 14684 / CCUG 47730 / CIP 108061 / JCM 11494 / NBRC 100937 / ID131577) TaxID=469383 RepID=D3F3Q2_CONWI|nr:phosphotransferase family protein [Conexibacter woesei]ADB52417.1 aminoglycoside phosphotransferase [Conexibacter woesei DSM 14684]
MSAGQTSQGQTLEEGAAARIVADLTDLLAERLSAPVAIDGLEPFGDGHSGFTYTVVVRRGGGSERCVLRLSPPGVRIGGPADVGRQARIMAAVGAAGLPVPRILAADSAPCVDGRAFALMELVDGEPWTAAVAQTSPRRVAAAAVRVLGRLRTLAPSETGIAGEPVATPADEVARWRGLAARGVGGDEAAALGAALEAALPRPAAVPALVHGDLHYANLLFGDGEVVALLDWEIAGLGEPLADLGCLAVAGLRWRYPSDPNPTGPRQVAVPELLELYGADEREAGWFIAAACLKYSAIIGYNLHLHRSGRRIDPLYEQLQHTRAGLLRDGLTILSDGVAAVPWNVHG